MKKTFRYGPWLVEYTPEDGARLNRLCYDNYDLLTREPQSFKAPAADYGEYEKRPVYGYDDCFPSVEVTSFPGIRWEIPDHGEVCWLKWDYIEKKDRLIFDTRSRVIPAQIRREMVFTDYRITWNFEVNNEGNRKLPFQHVMHPLMKLDDISGIFLPGFKSVYDRTNNKNLNLKNTYEVNEFLLNQPPGTECMLFLRQVNEGKMSWVYKNSLLLKVTFPSDFFPSIGIWWNNNGYPSEKAIQRNECAFEPIPGSSSVLSEAYEEKSCLEVLPKKKFKWQITWEIFR